jgi:anaerobic selenocysteine-containing dehydrogenase
VTTHKTFCRLCIAACGLDVEVVDGRAVSVRGDASHPISSGYACSKGRALADHHHDDRRLDSPRVRSADGDQHVASWDEALSDLAARLTDVVRAHGVNSVGFFIGGGVFNDSTAYWAAKRLQRRLGTPHCYSTMSIDSSAKYRVAELMAGTYALTPQIDPEAKLIVMLGTNPVVSHGQLPMFENPIEKLRATTTSADLWVVDPRTTETARFADHHLAIRPGTDYALLAYLVGEALAVADHATLEQRAVGVGELAAAVEPYTLDRAADVTGLASADVVALRDAMLATGRLAVLSGTGVTMSAAGNAAEWLELALLLVTDSFDRPGGVWCNPGYLAKLDQRQQLPPVPPWAPGPPGAPTASRLLGEWPSALIPPAIERGELHALVVLGANLVTCLPDTTRAVAALQQLDVLAVLDVATNPTTELATHVLPVHAQFERPDIALLTDLFFPQPATQYTEAVLPRHPDRRQGWWLIAKIAAMLGTDIVPEGLDLDTADEHDVLAHVAGADLIDRMRSEHRTWEVAERPAHGWVDQRLPAGRWNLAPDQLVAQFADVVAPPPLVLIPRRQPKRLNGTTFRDGDRPDVLINPVDASRAGVSDGDEVEIVTAAGSLRALATVTESIRSGAVSLGHGWADVNVNQLIACDDLDPLTGMPRMSGTDVKIARVTAVGA